MQYTLIAAFLVLFMAALFRSAYALAFLILMFPLEIILQAGSPVLRSSTIGLWGVNIAAMVVCMWNAFRLAFNGQLHLGRYASPASLFTIALYVWSSITLLWSPGASDGLELMSSQWPYVLVGLFLAPPLATGKDTIIRAEKALLIIGAGLCAVTLTSSDFTSIGGRLVVEYDANVKSNPLAIGELGGIAIILGLTTGKSVAWWIAPLRWCAVLMGAAVSIRSGSRGQFLFALVIAVAFVPIATKVRSVKNLLLSAVAVVVFLAISQYLMDSLLTGFAAKRFGFEEIVYGNSSSDTRLSNVSSLASAWAANPLAWLFGLGFASFGQLSGSIGGYSHVMFADAIFELGFVGFALLLGFMSSVLAAAIRLFVANKDDPAARAGVGAWIALFVYQALLVNKQGNLWGNVWFFMIGLVIARLDSARQDSADTSI